MTIPLRAQHLIAYFLVVSAAAFVVSALTALVSTLGAVVSGAGATAVVSLVSVVAALSLQATNATIAKANNAFFIMMIFKFLNNYLTYNTTMAKKVTRKI
ncbi:MAG: hypothetical protein HYX40_08460 [Sphingobacteriales bacterium]|nr:hypothetical protein [Sphingobacteriales bacterium]